MVLRVGSAVRNWRPGDRAAVHCNFVDDQDPSAHDDSMLAANQRIWGFESNYGGLADLSIVKANQIMPKPSHLTWEEVKHSVAIGVGRAMPEFRQIYGDIEDIRDLDYRDDKALETIRGMLWEGVYGPGIES